MSKDHPHTHERALKIAIAIAIVFMIIEVIAGIWANSLALISDALHMFTDVGAFFLSIIVLRIARRPHTPRMSFGYHRAEILGALASAASLWALTMLLVYEAIKRFFHPAEVQGPVVFVIATLGLLANIAMMRVLHKGHDHNLNMKAAYLHAFGDLLGSIGVIASGIIIWATNWYYADPIITILFAIALLYQSGSIIRQSVKILMQSTPEEIDPDAIRKDLLEIPGIIEIHDLHIWSVTTKRIALSAHVISRSHDALKKVHDLIKNKYGIIHMTIQIEDPDQFEPRYCFDYNNKR